MKTLIIDASVVAAAFFAEEHATIARKILSGAATLCAPDFITVEVASVIWKRHRRGEMESNEAMDLLADADGLPLMKTPASDLTDSALQLAMRTDRSIYDCLYLALAVRASGVMITADKRLVHAVAASPLKNHIAFLGDMSV